MISPFMEWSKDYETGNHDIDIDHKGLFTLVNELYAKVQRGSDEISLDMTISTLEDYVRVHFEREEALMAFCGFNGLDKHIVEHRKLAKQVEQYRMLFESDPSNFDIQDFIGFLSNWLTNHILFEDMQYVDAFREPAKRTS